MSEAHESAGPTTLEKEPRGGSGSGQGDGDGTGTAGAAGSAAADEPEDSGRTHAGRFWSTRRGPAGIVALVLLAAVGVVLYDVASVRADRPGMAWRRTLADELARTHVDSAPVIAGAAVAAVLGLWLLVLALTPGRRSLLTMRRDTPQVRAGLERSAAALVLRDRAMEVSGVQSVRVKVKRRKAVARAQAHFRDLDEVRSDLDTALEQGIEQLGLDRRLGQSVRVRRPAKR